MKKFLFAAFLAGALALPAEARTWTVGGGGADFPLIGPALAAAADGDTVSVRAGVYREDLRLARTIALVGEGRPLVIGTGEGTVIEVAAAGSRVRGFDIEESGTGAGNRMDAAVRVAAPAVGVEDNRMRRVFYGVVVEGVSGCEIAGNSIEGFGLLPFGQRGDGIYLYRAPDNAILRNRIAGMRDAIYLQYSPRCRAEGNTVSSSRYGLHDMFSDDARVLGNRFSDCSAGANVMNCRRIAIRANRFESNRGVSSVGLALKECDDSRVEENAVSDNARGLQLDGSSGNRFERNLFRDNDTALLLFASAEENVFTGNDFRQNLSALVLSGATRTSTRFSDRGRGNQWSGYRGFDFDGDGVGDSPHPLLPVFERLEGNAPAVRLFLLSPAAGALELAARALPAAGDAVADPAPLVGNGPRLSADRASRTGRAAGGALAGTLLLGCAAAALVKVRPC